MKIGAIVYDILNPNRPYKILEMFMNLTRLARPSVAIRMVLRDCIRLHDPVQRSCKDCMGSLPTRPINERPSYDLTRLKISFELKAKPVA